MSLDKINFIFFWRFEDWKGFDLLIDLIDTLNQDKRAWRNNIIDQVRFFVFWDWTLKNRFLLKLDNLIQNMEEFQESDKLIYSNKPVYYFWWKPRSIIDSFLDRSNFCLMPSRFIETFWLTALESLTKWVPVIWFGKWWLKQFLLDDLNIDKVEWFNDFDKFYNLFLLLLKKVNENYIDRLSNMSKYIADKYDKYKWLSKFQSIADDSKKLLLVSDYSTNIWGIESFLYKVSDFLSFNWYQVDILWWNWFSGKLTKLDRILWLPLTALNFVFKWRLEEKIKTYKPDIIWFNSIHRFLWWYIFEWLKDYRWKVFVMYHDFGFFHPYPSVLNNEADLEYIFWFRSFLKAANTKNPICLIAVLLKFIACSMLKKQLLKHADFHLVPSEFMLSTLRNYWVPIDEYMVLPHFKD